MSFSLKSKKFLKVIPHSSPLLTSLAAFFSLNILAISPSYMTLPSRIILALELFFISPSVTLEPATFPDLESLKIFKISAVPCTFSFRSGSSRPERDFSTCSIALYIILKNSILIF